MPILLLIAAVLAVCAAMLLRATSLPVAEVARRVGYAGTSNFYRAFREQYGCSPAELRAGDRK